MSIVHLFTPGTSIINSSHLPASSTGGISSIVNNDNSINVTETSGNVVLSNAGSKWSNYTALSNLNLGNNSILNCNGITCASLVTSSLSLQTANIPSLTSQNITTSLINGKVPGTITGITSTDSSVSVSTISSKVNLTVPNWATQDALSEVAMNSNSIQGLCSFQLSNFSQPKPITVYQSYSNDPITSTSGLRITDGNIGGTGNIGVVYDTFFNPLPTVRGSASVLAFSNYIPNGQQISPSISTMVNWNLPDLINSIGTTGLVQTNLNQITNPHGSGSSFVLNVSGFVTWSKASTPTTTVAVYGAKNAFPSSDRYGYMNMAAGSDFPCTPFNFVITLAQGDFFSIYCWTNDTTSQTINTAGFPGSRLIITRLA